MTAPTPPPGWHQDPADANLLRYWDGTQWTEQTQPKPSQTPTPQKEGGVGKVLLILVAVLVVMGILGSVFGGGDKEDDRPAAAGQRPPQRHRSPRHDLQRHDLQRHRRHPRRPLHRPRPHRPQHRPRPRDLRFPRPTRAAPRRTKRSLPSSSRGSPRPACRSSTAR
ncbi:DUF2510 domain-containing protein [Rhodococcus wratislaviensis]|uniref:DUF2510 domain-containing protein n=1 Tax=Rhodococcus wratislaviensis TaxID=44752 RepID=UPI00351387AC